MKPSECLHSVGRFLSSSSAAALWAAYGLAYALTGAVAMSHTVLAPDDRLAAVVLGLLLSALSAVDTHRFRLPDVLNLALATCGLAFAARHGPEQLAWSAASALIGFSAMWLVARAYQRLRNRPGLGMGDAKLLGAAGCWVGAAALPTVVLIGAGTALLAAVVIAFSGRRMRLDTALPFGPFLAFGLWMTWLWGPL